MEYVLEATDITKKFPAYWPTTCLLNVQAGEVLGLIGENGAGKSTLLKVLNGIYPYGTYEGVLKINGEEIRPMNTNDAMRCGIGYVPQEINVLKNFSVAENIFMSDLRLQKYNDGKNAGSKNEKTPFVSFRAMYAATEKLLAENHISLDPRADVRKLSIGQQQMLMIARALAGEPKVLILDEPTTSLSDSDVKQLFTVVRRLKQGGKSIIFVTHKLAEILELTDRVTILRDGRNISTFVAAEYDTNRIIADMIGAGNHQPLPQARQSDRRGGSPRGASHGRSSLHLQQELGGGYFLLGARGGGAGHGRAGRRRPLRGLHGFVRHDCGEVRENILERETHKGKKH